MASISRTDDSTPQPESQKKAVLCVFCGAAAGSTPEYLSAARELAQAMHAANMNLVYGGGSIGVMGEVAKTLVSLSGPDSVHGVIPRALLQAERKYLENGSKDENDAQKAIHAERFGRTTVVEDMHTRKQTMAREVIEGGPGSGFVALPGGYGTLEELAEVITWNQLGIHSRGIVVYNVAGYWDGLLQWRDKAVETTFVTEKNRDILVEAESGQEVVDKLREYKNSEGRYLLSWGQK